MLGEVLKGSIVGQVRPYSCEYPVIIEIGPLAYSGRIVGPFWRVYQENCGKAADVVRFEIVAHVG